jgi:hypothetical protein
MASFEFMIWPWQERKYGSVAAAAQELTRRHWLTCHRNTSSVIRRRVPPFRGMLAFETDCWDSHESLKSPKPDFILVDVHGPASFANGRFVIPAQDTAHACGTQGKHQTCSLVYLARIVNRLVRGNHSPARACTHQRASDRYGIFKSGRFGGVGFWSGLTFNFPSRNLPS